MMTRRRGILIILSLATLLVALTTWASVAQERQPPPTDIVFDLLIDNGLVIDGTGAPVFRADVLVHGGRIVFLGEVDRELVRAARVIEAEGRVVSPGFIDAHAHGNPVREPAFENFLAMGVTTITLGQDGSSPGGVHPGEWLDEVDAVVPGVNIVLFVGHGTVRRLAGVGISLDPDAEQLRTMADLVEGAMREGCFGLSTGLEYQPGSFAGMAELVAIAEPVGRAGGLVMSHLRTEDDDKIESALAELIAQGRGAECPIQISHIKVVYGHGAERGEEILGVLEEARGAGVTVTADIYPYEASYTGIGIVFPDWAKPPNEYAEVVAERRKELGAFLRQRVMQRNGPAATLFGTRPWSGKTLAQVAAELDKPFEDVLIDDIGPGGASGAYFVMDPGLQERLLVDPHIMISTDGSPTMRHPRGYGAFAKVIRQYVAERGLLTLEEAIRKMTGLPASILGLDRQQRGLVRVGWAADLLVFDPSAVSDNATFEEPHLLAEGFDWVIVNGRVVRAEGEFSGMRNGRALRDH
jgi:N-acyl-D-aspartate/D-glutamate deacylase